jgi:hypothetical protein
MGFQQDKMLKVERYRADWAKHGRAAGPIRNKQMLEEGKPDLVVAFPGGQGTANMMSQVREAGVRVMAITPTLAEASDAPHRSGR